jgi:ABC-type polysaccharide/polyol phosphate export permease
MLPRIMRGIAAHRDLLSLLVRREIRIRYARAFLGIGWALFLPLVMMVVFTVLNFARLVPEASRYRDVPYPVFAYCGLLFWTHFATSLTQATPSLVVSASLLKKCAFPRGVIPLAKVLAPLLDLAIGALFLVGLMVWYRIPVGPGVLALPLILVLQLAFTQGLALLFSAGNMYYRDVNYLVQVGLVLAMFATSVVYPIELVNPTARAVLSLNPMSSYLDAYRDVLLLGRWPGPGLLVGAVGAAGSLVLGSLVFRRLSPRFAEEV